MQESKSLVLFRRFLKGFTAGGLASVATFLGTPLVIDSAADLKRALISVSVAFLTGGLLTLEKALNWKDEPQEPQA